MIKRKNIVVFIIFAIVLFRGFSLSQTSFNSLDRLYVEYSKGDDTKYDEILEAFKAKAEYSGQAAIILGKIRDPRATQALSTELLQDGAFAKESLFALGMILDKRSVPILIRIIKENRPYAQRAVQIIGELKDERAVPALLEVIIERRPYYLDAFSALGNIGDRSVLPHLLEFLEKPTPDEPENLKFKIVHKDTDDPLRTHTRTFQYIGKNIPPRISIIDYQINPIGIVWINYKLYDNDLDTLNIIPEFSQDGGKSWSKATVEGRISNITSNNYDGEIYWRADKDSIKYSSSTRIVFKLTPTNKYLKIPNGVFEAVSIGLKFDDIALRDIYTEVNSNITFSVYFPGDIKDQTDIFNYMYSLNGGKNWIPASAKLMTKAAQVAPDSELVVWKSDEDLPSFDSENVSFLISLGGGKNFGRYDATIPFHLDNNKPPSIKILSINDAELLEIEYQIRDIENDSIGLSIEFSRNGGISWEKATISKTLTKLAPANYHGVLKWYADFDIPQIKESPIKLRISPFDNDLGEPAETKAFFLKSSYYTHPTEGLSENDLMLKYYNTTEDSSLPAIQYSTDGGEVWRDASAKNVASIRKDDKYTNVINWEVNQDLIFPRKRMDIFTTVLNQMADPSIVPELLLISKQINSQSYLERKNAIQTIMILEEKPKWVKEGLVTSLLNESSIVRETAAGHLRNIDEPRIQEALVSYDNYWKEFYRTQNEMLTSEQESMYYAQELNNLKTYKPTQTDVSEFMKNKLMEQGMREKRADEFMIQLELFRTTKQLKAQYDARIISKAEYERRVKEEIRKHELNKLQNGYK
ncbi:HEAT repeat domain-containing protein [candidate division KSB1 bacterium]